MPPSKTCLTHNTRFVRSNKTIPPIKPRNYISRVSMARSKLFPKLPVISRTIVVVRSQILSILTVLAGITNICLR